MMPVALPILAQLAPAADTLASVSPEALGGGAVGALGISGMVAGLLKWAAGAILRRLDAQDVRIVALEAALADLRGDARVAAERDRHLRELLTTIKSTVEHSR